MTPYLDHLFLYCIVPTYTNLHLGWDLGIYLGGIYGIWIRTIGGVWCSGGSASGRRPTKSLETQRQLRLENILLWIAFALWK